MSTKNSDSGSTWFGGGGGSYNPCYKTHPPLVLGTVSIYGGSCHSPIVTDANVYLGLDGSMKTGLALPWEGGVEFLYPITDMQAPKDAKSFRKLVDWVCNQLHSGKKVHVGCIGGHGRTGTLLSAVASVVLNEKDAITYVREHYCKKVVESKAQIDFLHTHFGVDKVKPTKGDFVSHEGGYGKFYTPKEYETTWEPEHRKQKSLDYGEDKIKRYDSRGNILGFERSKYERDKYAKGGSGKSGLSGGKKTRIAKSTSAKCLWADI